MFPVRDLARAIWGLVVLKLSWGVIVATPFVQHFVSAELLSGEVLADILKGYSTHASSLKQNLLDPDNLHPVPNILAESLGDHVQNLA